MYHAHRGWGATEGETPVEVIQGPPPTSAQPAAFVEAKSPPSTYAVASVLDGEQGAWARLAGLTFLRALFIFPGLYVGSKVFAPELKSWQISVLSLASSITISGGMLALYAFQKDQHQSPIMLDGIGKTRRYRR